MTEATPEKETVDQHKEKKSTIFSWVLFLVFLASVFLFFKYVVGITIVSGQSMAPTLANKDIVITSNLFYTPKRNDIVIYKDDQGNHIIKRVVGLPNETVEICNGTVFINNHPLDEKYILGNSENMDEITINDQSYFLIGDNRNPGKSLDSRNEEIGPIKEEDLVGKAIFSLYPFKLSFNE